MATLVSIIIPVYNEASLVEELVRRVESVGLHPFVRELVIVNDGSSDGTFYVLEKLRRQYDNIRVLHLEENSGKSAALREGFSAAGGDIIIVQDADLEYSPEDYSAMLRQFSDPSVGAVYGSRFLENFWPENMMLHNWLANRLFTLLVNLLFGTVITDEGTAYKVFRADVLKQIPLNASGFSFCAEVTCKLALGKIAIREVPIDYRARGVSDGKKPRFLDGVKVVKTIIGIRLGLLK